MRFVLRSCGGKHHRRRWRPQTRTGVDGRATDGRARSFIFEAFSADQLRRSEMPRMMHLKSYYAGYILAFPLISLPTASAHSRWSCPEPRSPSTSIKDGPCGDETTNNFIVSSEDMMEIRPGPLRVVFEESIYHTGAPFRISLSADGTDSEACTLLDHIPHNDLAVRPNFRDESTYTQYAVTIDIPDVNCERCSLHLSNPMTDKI